MRATVLAAAAIFGLLALPATSQAAPAAIGHPSASGAAPLVLVRGGCGPGFHPVVWRDRWGRLHRQCVPNRRWGPPPPRYPYNYYYR
jgi:hypothetical protein